MEEQIAPRFELLLAGVGHVLVSLFAQQAQKGHLHDAHRVVRDPEPASEVRVPSVTTFAPRYVGHFAATVMAPF